MMLCSILSCRCRVSNASILPRDFERLRLDPAQMGHENFTRPFHSDAKEGLDGFGIPELPGFQANRDAVSCENFRKIMSKTG